jgi:hypothetical protein
MVHIGRFKDKHRVIDTTAAIITTLGGYAQQLCNLRRRLVRCDLRFASLLLLLLYLLLYLAFEDRRAMRLACRYVYCFVEYVPSSTTHIRKRFGSSPEPLVA